MSVPSKKIAVIDIGTNTLLLLIVDERGQRLVDLARFGRLGKGLDASGMLAEDSIATSLDILREYRRVLDDHGIAAPIAIATQATREANNAADFVGPAERILGTQIRVISGEREAELAFASVQSALPELAGHPYLVVDVGGGSSEHIVTDGKRVVSAVSIPIGARRLTERHLASDPPSGGEIGSLYADIDSRLAALELPTGVPVVGTAGTATSLAAMELGLASYDPDRVTGYSISPQRMQARLDQLLGMTVAARKRIVGLEPQRADVIAAGVAILMRLVRRVNAPRFIACDRGIRWGIAYEELARN